MEDVSVKLECLKLAHTHGHATEVVIGRAKMYEAYVLDSKETRPNDPSTPARQDQKAKK